MKSRLTDKLQPWVEESIEKHGQGEDVTWEMLILPNPQNEFSFFFMFAIPSGLINQSETALVGLPIDAILRLGPGEIDNLVATSLENLRKERTQRLNDNMRNSLTQGGIASAATLNGNHP